MSQVTIRNMDKEVEQIIRQKAAAMNESLSSVINQLLRQVLGLEKNSGKKRNLRKLAGKWGGEELAEFEETQKVFNRIDDELWK